MFLAFTAVGALANDDFRLPDNVYVGYGSKCQVLSKTNCAKLQDAAKFGGNYGFMNAMAMAQDAPKTPCPK